MDQNENELDPTSHGIFNPRISKRTNGEPCLVKLPQKDKPLKKQAAILYNRQNVLYNADLQSIHTTSQACSA